MHSLFSFVVLLPQLSNKAADRRGDRGTELIVSCSLFFHFLIVVLSVLCQSEVCHLEEGRNCQLSPEAARGERLGEAQAAAISKKTRFVWRDD